MSASPHEPFTPGELPRQAAPGGYRGPVLAKSQLPAKAGQWPAMAALLGLALLLRLPFLRGPSLWLDEMWSIGTARLPWSKLLWLVLHRDTNASFYYVVLHLWLRLGSSEASVRALSLLLGMAAIPVLYRLGNRLLGEPIGLIASLLLIANRLHISQSQDTRGYSLLVLLVTLSSLYFVRCIERSKTKDWCVYALLSVLAVYTHIFGILILAAHASSLLFLRRREIPWKGVLASAAVIAAAVAPLLFLLVIRMGEPGAPLSWAPYPSLSVLARLGWSLSGGSHFGISWGLAAGIALSLAYGGLCLAFLADGIRRWRQLGPGLETWRWGLVFCGLVVPIALATAVSFKVPMLVDKYLIVCLPALTIAAARGLQYLAATRTAKWTVAATALMVALGVIGSLPYFYTRGHNREWQDVTRSIVSQARPGDAIIFYVAPGRLLYDYYGGESPRSAPDRPYAQPTVLFPQFREISDPESLEYLPTLNPKVVEGAASQYSRVWLVLYHHDLAATRPLGEQVQSELSAQYRKVEDSHFAGEPFYERTEVQLYSKD